MEELGTRTIDVHLDGRTIHCTLKEKDFGDYIVYEVYDKEQYLFTISKEGEVLFKEEEMNQEVILDPRDLNEVIEVVRGKINEV